MGLQYLVDVARAMAGDSGDLRGGASRECKPRYCGPAQIMEVKIGVAEICFVERFTPRRAEAVAGLRAALPHRDAGSPWSVAKP